MTEYADKAYKSSEEGLEQEVIYVDADKKPIPIGTIRTTRVYDEIEKGVAEGKTCISEQGGTRSGKTVTTMIWVVLQCLQNAIKVGISRKTLPTVKATVFQDFKDVMRQMGIWEEDRFNKTDMTYYFDNGSNIIFFAADQAEKLKGRKNRITWLNEASEFQYHDYQQLRFRTEQLMILDYNPNYSANHWLNDVNEDSRTHWFITTYRDNPFLPQTIIDEIESMKKKNVQMWMQFGEGQRCYSFGRVFQSVKVVDEMPDVRERYIGLDFGFSNDPTAIVMVAITKERLYIKEIAYARGMFPSDIRKILMRKEYSGYNMVCDSSNPMIIEEIKRGGGLERLVPVNKRGRLGKQVRLTAIQKMSQYEICVVDGSDNVLKEFTEYHWLEDANGELTNDTNHDADHSIDAARYVTMTYAKIKRKGVRIR